MKQKNLLALILVFAITVPLLTAVPSLAAVQSDLYEKAPLILPFSSDEGLIKSVVTDKTFIKNHAELADAMGYVYTSGSDDYLPGEGAYTVNYLGDGRYGVKFNYDKSDRYAQGKWADQRFEMIFSNFKVNIDGNTLSFGEPRITKLEPSAVFVDIVENQDPEATVTKHPKFVYTTESTWERTDEYTFGQSLGIENKYAFNAGFMGTETTFSLNLDFTQGWSTSKGSSESKQYEEVLDVELKPLHKSVVKFLATKEEADLPYSADVYVTYDVTFKGLLGEENLHNAPPETINTDEDYFAARQPISDVVVETTFGGNGKSAAQDLLDQYLYGHIQGFSDWNFSAYEGYGYHVTVLDALSNIIKKRYGGVATGTFKALSKVTIQGIVEPQVPISSRVKRSSEPFGELTDAVQGLSNLHDIIVTVD